jgi:hypothetical protein
VSHSLKHIEEFKCQISPIDLPESDFQVSFIQIFEGRFYLEANKTLFVYSMSDTTSPIDSYPIGGHSYSSLIFDNILYIGGEKVLYIFKVGTSV